MEYKVEKYISTDQTTREINKAIKEWWSFCSISSAMPWTFAVVFKRKRWEEMNNEVTICAVDKEHLPQQAHDTDAGFDVYARENYIIAPHSIVNIPVWVKVAMPKGMVCLVFPRSSLPLKKGLMLSNSVWVVDAWYRWEIHMQLYNLNDTEVMIEHWEKIWQLIFTNYSSNVCYAIGDEDYDKFEELYPSDRWANGFGSTWN